MPLFIMRPQAEYLDALHGRINLINHAMLNVEAARVNIGHSFELFAGRRGLKWVLANDVKQFFNLAAQMRLSAKGNLLRGRPCKAYFITHARASASGTQSSHAVSSPS